MEFKIFEKIKIKKVNMALLMKNTCEILEKKI
jgi:hypothetical protein